MALAVRLRSGDTSALRKAVLSLRPSAGALAWSFVVGEWVAAAQPGAIARDDARALIYHARYLLRSSRPSEALDLCRYVAAARPANELERELFVTIAWAHIGRGEWSEAVASASKAIAADPQEPEAQVAGAIALAGLGHTQPALQALALARALKPDYAFAHYVEGGILSDTGRPAAAAEAFRRCLAIVTASDPALRRAAERQLARALSGGAPAPPVKSSSAPAKPQAALPSPVAAPPPADPNAPAVLKGGSKVYGCDLSLVFVDGLPPRRGRAFYGSRWSGSYEIPLEPGLHELQFTYSITDLFQTSPTVADDKPQAVQFEAKPGRTYRVVAQRVRDYCKPTVVEEVAGKK
jgi:tetratricopeptide (TPR) repeat protein